MSSCNQILYIERIQKLINQFYNFPLLIKIEDTNDGYSVYATKVHCLLKAKRYLIFYSQIDTNKIGSFIKLQDLNWISMYAKSINDDKNPVVQLVNICHNYEPKKIKELNKKINLIQDKKSQNDKYNIYISEDNFLKVYLFLKDNSIYSPNGTILKALETYSTLLTFNI